jgi:hypothetical protein
MVFDISTKNQIAMQKLILLSTAVVFLSAKKPETSIQQLPLGIFNGSATSLCYTNEHLAHIMTYFMNTGNLYYNVNLNYNETEGFYLEGTAKNDNRYTETKISLKKEGNKLFITNASKAYFCLSPIEGDCTIKVVKLDNRRTRYEPISKSNSYKDVSPGVYTLSKNELPDNLVNYINNLNVEDCN